MGAPPLSLGRRSIRALCEPMFVSKYAERAEARRLREIDGESVKVIARRLGVAPSTASRWVRDIELTPDQQASLATRNARFAGQNKGHRARRDNARAQRLAWQQAGRARAIEGDPLHRAGCMSHWAEGNKDRGRVVFCNSDVDMMRLFGRFLRECFGVADDRLTFYVNCFLGNGLSLADIEAFWLDALALPRASLRKSIVNRPSSASRGRGRILLYGTGRVTLCSTEVAQSIYGAIQEYGGFERPAWLD